MLNCANIGCDFGENVEQRGAGSKFSWEGVERACSFYDKEGFVVHAIIGQRLLHKAGREQVSAKLLSRTAGRSCVVLKHWNLVPAGQHMIVIAKQLSEIQSHKPSRLNDALVVIPSRDEMRDNDDFSTILEAYKYKCQFVSWMQWVLCQSVMFLDSSQAWVLRRPAHLLGVSRVISAVLDRQIDCPFSTSSTSAAA